MNTKNQQSRDQAKQPLGDINPDQDVKDQVGKTPARDRADDRERPSTRVNDEGVGERVDREPTDPQRNPRTGPIG